MRRCRAWLFAALVAASLVCFAEEAEAFNTCNEACAYIAYAMVTGGGLVTAAGSQITLLEGEPDPSWGYASLGLAGANAGVAGVLLIVAGVAAALDDDEMATGFAMWGGIQMSVAVAGLVSGAQVVANAEPAPGERLEPQPSGLTVTIPF